MENNVDIKELWNRQTVPAADPSGLLKRIGNFKRRGIRRAVLLNVVLLLSILLIAFVWVYFKPQLLTTKIGIVLTILPIGVAIASNCRLFPLYKRIDESRSNFDYLNELLAVKSRGGFLQTKILNLYFVLLSVGIGMYMYEYVAGRPLMFGIIAYAAFLLWVAFNWFVLRPKSIRKNNREIEQLIGQVERIRLQLNKSM
ncbi:hypothetical protein [Bacteroides sp.]|uniref:hypothetical protein n=1 Tax=Bacteroides sp. TaxID=29523 RepID=UPI003AB2CCA4